MKANLRAWILPGLVFLTTCIVLVAFADTRVEHFRTSDTTGWWHARLWEANAVFAPVAVLLFALGVHDLVHRRWPRALVALPGLPAWTAALLSFDNIVSNDFWFLLVGLQLQGLKPFGGA